METKTIEVPKKYEYLGQLKDAEEIEVSQHFQKGLPVNCLFDKGKTGCGGTTIALTNEKDTIIAMPYVATIKNKVIQAEKDKEEYPFELLGIYAGVTDNDILDYINTHEVKKLLVTYDSLIRLINIIPNIYNDYYLLVDEYHVLFTSYLFRDRAVKNTLYHSRNFKEVTYMTATPIEKEFRLKELADLPIVTVEWEDVTTTNIQPMIVNLPINKVCELIKDRLNGKTFNHNLHFFVNSVDFIAQAIKKAELAPSQVRVICSENTNVGKGKKTNQKKLGNDYRIQQTTDKAKIVNFYTSTCFEGADLYDENGKTYIVSDSSKSHTLLDISTLFIQICGRIRNSNYNDKITHIFSTTRYNEFTDFDEFKQTTNVERAKTLKWLDNINNMDEDSKLRTIKLVEKNNTGLNEMYISRVDNKLELDENLINLDIFNFKITNHLYNARITLSNEYAKNGFNVLKAQYTQYEATDKLKKNNKAKVSFEKLFIEYVALKAKEPLFNFNFGNANERITLIEQEKPLVQEAYQKLGAEKVKELKYLVTNVKREITKIDIERQTDIATDTKIVKLLAEKGIKAGEWQTSKYIKDTLTDIYDIGFRFPSIQILLYFMSK